jgi:hypothetical protein
MERKGTLMLLVRKPEEKRPLGRPRYRWWIILRDIGIDIEI